MENQEFRIPVDRGADSEGDGYDTATDRVQNDGLEQQLEGIRSQNMGDDKDIIIQFVHDLKDKNKREKALAELSKKREHLQDLAPVIWHSIGTISALLQEIISIYPLLVPSLMTANVSNRACNVLALLQCVAAHPETRSSFLKANIQLFLYPFLNTISKSRPYEYLRLTSLGVIGALVKIDDPEVINNLLHTEIIPLCLRIMERGTELSQTVATFIIQKILSDANGLNYVCHTKQRFFTVVTVMETMVKAQTKATPSQRLLKHIARCYQKLFENQNAKESLATNVPTIINDPSLEDYFDESTKQVVQSMRELIKAWNEAQQRIRYNPQVASPGLYQPRQTMPTMYKMNSQSSYMHPTQNIGGFPRPGSSQSHITPLESQGLSRGILPQSPPIQQNMQSQMPHPSMIRMYQNQSPYQMYQRMPPGQMVYNGTGMASPGLYNMPQNMASQGYMMPPPQPMPRNQPK